MKFSSLLSWVLQVACAAILIPVGWFKLSNDPTEVAIFTKLGMEPTGRFIIGLIELTSGLFLISPRLAATGALLALGTMMGAILAHVFVLGFEGNLAYVLSFVFFSSFTITVIRRKQLPLVGNSLE